MSRALVLLIEAQAFLSDGTDAPLIRLVSGGSRADHFGEQWYPALTQLPLMGARLGFDGRSFQAPVTSTTGNFAFSLHMGDLERAADHIWDGADIKIYQGFDGDGDGDFNLLWHGRAASSQATEEAISVTLADPAQDLNKPILSERFQGTGGIEGGEDLKGRLKPKAWGFCENVPGILVDPANLVYRFIDGPSTILQVKDGGVPFNAGTDYPDYASLAAASVPDGAVAFCSSLSLVKVWRAPRYTLTADLTAFGPMRIGDIAQNLVNGASLVTFAPNTLSNFNALQPSLASSYVEDERTIAQELDRLFGGVGAWWMPNSQGEIRVGQVDFGAVVLDVTGSVENIARQKTFSPTYRRVLGYRPNYKPLSDGDIAGAVAAGDIDDLGALATQSTINWENQVTGRPLSFRVVARGTASVGHPASGGLYDDAGTQLAGEALSYTVNVMDRATRNFISHTAYDVENNGANAQAMADALNALGNDRIVVIHSHGNPQMNRLLNGLPAALKRCGASRPIFESANFKSAGAYVLIGIPGLGEGNGVELYAGDADNDPDAWIETNFIVDNLGNLQLASTNVRDAVDISYSDGTVVNDVQPEEAGANVTGTNVSAGFAGQGALATLSNIPQAIADDSNLLQYAGGGQYTGDLNAEANLAASNALNKGWMTDDLKHWYGDVNATTPLANVYSIATTTDGIVSDKAIRGVDSSITSARDIFSEHIAIDPARNYQVTLWARQPSGDQTNYILVAFSRADKSNIQGNGGNSNATGWDNKGTYHYHRIVNQVFPTTWTKYQFTFGLQGEASIPNTPGHEAVFAQIGILCLRNGTTETTVEIQGLRLDEIADATQLINGPAEAGANVTGNNIASGISGQGSLATASSVNWGTDITGPRPIDQAYDEMSYANSTEFFVNWLRTGAGAPNSEITSISSIEVPGGRALRIGNNSGNDELWAYSTKARMPYDPNALYEVGIIARKISGSGSFYCGVNGRDANGNAVNVSGSNTLSSQHYFAASAVGLSSSWKTYRGYFKGQSTSGSGGQHNSPADPGTVHSNAVYVEPMFLVNYSNLPGITDVAAVWLRKLSPAEFIDSRNARQSLVGGQSNAITTAYLSAVDAGTTATINISSHTRRYDFGDLTYNAGSISGRSFSTRYYIYAVDSGFTGGSVTYQATTSHSNAIGVNNIYLGSIVTPANGSSGGGSTFPDDCLAAHMLLSNGKYARDLEVGDMIDVMDDDMNHVGERPVLALRHAKQNCVELVTKSARVVVSTTAPVVTKERGTLYAPEVKGLTVAVRIKGSFGFEQVLDVRPVGEKPIVRINVGGISFSAGQEADRMIYTHNIYFKP